MQTPEETLEQLENNNNIVFGRGCWVGLKENKEAEKYTQIPIYFVRDCRSLIINTVETYDKKTIAKLVSGKAGYLMFGRLWGTAKNLQTTRKKGFSVAMNI